MTKSFGYVYSRFFTPVASLVFCSAWLLTTVTGPFGTFDGMSLGLRAVYWLLIVTGAFVMGYTVFALVLGVFGPERRLTNSLVASGLMTVFFAPCVYLLRTYFSTISETLSVSPASIAVHVFLLSVIIFILRAKLVDDAKEMGDAAASDTTPRLLRRLPDAICCEVVRLEAQDHLIAIVTMTGRETVRMRFCDAIEEMDPIEGFCTHRSHWVVQDAVMRVERDGPGKVCLRLRNGDRVPVSRKYRPELDDRGFVIS